MAQKIWRDLMEQPKWRKHADSLLNAKGDTARQLQLVVSAELKRTISQKKKNPKM